MDKIALVSFDVEKGAELLECLDRAKLRINVALWVFLSEYEDWRLVLSARHFDTLDLREAYGLFHDWVAVGGFTPKNTPPVMILPMTDPFVRDLRRLFGKAKSTEGMRLGGQVIGERFVQEAYVYRIS